MIENEFKFLLTSEIFYQILSNLKCNYPDIISKKIVQINYYYDTDNLSLHDKNITLRVRQKENKLKLQCKTHNYNSEFSSLENHYEINDLPYCINFKNQNYNLQGCLLTHRESFKIDENIKIDFDINYYLGICDYEIEVEFEENSIDSVKLLLSQFGLKDVNSTNKSSRFFIQKNNLINIRR